MFKVAKSVAGRHGQLRLAFAAQKQCTVMTENFFRVPLQVMKPYHLPSGCVCVYLLSPTGGVVGGDDYQIDVTLGTASHVILTTQAATKVYGMPTHGATQRMRVRVGENGIFEYLPDPTILFRASQFDQAISIVLERGAKAVLQEIIMPGRLARGEVLVFKKYITRLEAEDLNGLLLFDTVNIEPKCRPHLRTLGILENYPCWGSWYLLGDFELNKPQWESLCGIAEPLLNSEQSTGGLTQLHRNGIAIRMLAHTVQPIQSTFQSIWNWLKTEHFGIEPVDLRKY